MGKKTGVDALVPSAGGEEISVHFAHGAHTDDSDDGVLVDGVGGGDVGTHGRGLVSCG